MCEGANFTKNCPFVTIRSTETHLVKCQMYQVKKITIIVTHLRCFVVQTLKYWN